MQPRALGRPVLVLIVCLLTAGSSGIPARAAVGRFTTSGPPGGTINALAISPAAPETVWAATYYNHNVEPKPGGLWVSHDRGRRWTTVYPLLFQGLGVLAADPTDADVVYAATTSLAGGGLFKTADGGATWAQLDGGFRSYINVVTIDPSDHQTLYLGDLMSGVWRSPDGGQTWEQRSTGIADPNVLSIAVDPFDPSRLWAGTLKRGAFRSTDGGLTWHGANSGLGGGREQVSSLVTDVTTPGLIHAGTSQGVFESTDGGDSWSESNSGMGTRFVKNLVAAPSDPRTLYAMAPSSGPWVSTDGGTTWTNVDTGLPNIDMGAAAVDPEDASHVYVGTGASGGVYESNDGGATWRRRVRGLGNGDVEMLATAPSDPHRVYAGEWMQSGMFRSTDRGRIWHSSDQGLPGLTYRVGIAVDPSDERVVYAATGPGVYKTTDSGEGWSKLRGSPTYASDIQIAPSDPSVLYASTAGTFQPTMFKSSDAGQSWQAVASGLPTSYGTGVAIDPANPDLVYAAFSGGGVFKSTNGGQSWTPASDGLDGEADLLAIDPSRPQVLYVDDFYSGTYRSDDGAAHWHRLPATDRCGDRYYYGLYLAVDPVHSGILYAAVEDNVCVSSDYGDHWRLLANIPGLYMEAMAISSDGSTIFLGTRGAGVLRYTTP